MLPRIIRTDADIRKYQINTIKVFNDNVIEITENQDYQISFNSGNNELSIFVTLTNDFPQEKPILKVNPIIVHPWVNSDGLILRAPGLLNFSIHSDLGRVIQAIIREFERNPPPLNGCNSAIMSPIIWDRLSPNSKLFFPQLNELSLEELEFLNENIDRQEEFLIELPQIQEQNRILDDYLMQIEEFADATLNINEQMVKLQQQINEKVEEVTKLTFENERLHTKYQDLSEKYSPFNIKEQLRQAAEDAEMESEKIADKFLKGEMDVDNFVAMYTKIRKLCQTRKTKEEKLSQQLQSLERAGF